jgi:copper homeostasis protein (lipoprotein)
MACDNAHRAWCLGQGEGQMRTLERIDWRTTQRWAGHMAASLALAACAAVPAPAPQALAPNTAGAVADATYAGTLPCADCAGQQIVLTLFADQTYRLRTRYLDARAGTGEDAYDLGRWTRDATGMVVLGAGRGPMQRFEPAEGGALRLLDMQGRPIVSSLNYALQRRSEIDRLSGPMRLRGMFQYMADAASLSECRTGKRWPVLPEGDHLALERAYLAQRGQGGELVLAAFSARFVMREPEPGLPPREVLRVEKFERLWPRETCAADALADASLLNTRWRVVEIDGQPVAPVEGQREPYIQLSTEGQRMQGFGGCNRLSGGFEQGGEGLLFKGLVGTRQACPAGAQEQEARLLAALQATATRRNIGQALQLRDAQGATRVRFEALYPE